MRPSRITAQTQCGTLIDKARGHRGFPSGWQLEQRNRADPIQQGNALTEWTRPRGVDRGKNAPRQFLVPGRGVAKDRNAGKLGRPSILVCRDCIQDYRNASTSENTEGDVQECSRPIEANDGGIGITDKQLSQA